MRDTQSIVVDSINFVCRPETPDLSDYDKSLLASGLDSLDFASLLMDLEDKTGVSFETIDLEKVNSVNGLTKFIDESRQSS